MNLVGRVHPASLLGAARLGQRPAVDGSRPSALTWADLGAGAGLPGLVLAIL